MPLAKVEFFGGAHFSGGVVSRQEDKAEIAGVSWTQFIASKQTKSIPAFLYVAVD